MTTVQRVIQIIRKATGLAPEEPVGGDTALVGAGLSLDSVAMLELVVAIEKEFGIELDRTEMAKIGALNTVGSLAELVDSKIKGEC